MKKYNFYFPNDFYVAEFYGDNEQEARENARKWLGKSRLPKGTGVELSDPESEQIIRESNERMAIEYCKAGTIMDF